MKYDPKTGVLCFSLALRELKRNQRMTRLGWSNPHVWVQYLDGVLMQHLPPDELFPWFPVQADLMAEDWVQLT